MKDLIYNASCNISCQLGEVYTSRAGTSRVSCAAWLLRLRWRSRGERLLAALPEVPRFSASEAFASVRAARADVPDLVAGRADRPLIKAPIRQSVRLIVEVDGAGCKFLFG